MVVNDEHFHKKTLINFQEMFGKYEENQSKPVVELDAGRKDGQRVIEEKMNLKKTLRKE